MFPKSLRLKTGKTVKRSEAHLLLTQSDRLTKSALTKIVKQKGVSVAAPKSKEKDGATANQSSNHVFLESNSGTEALAAKLPKTKSAVIHPVYYGDKEDLRTYFAVRQDTLVVETNGKFDPKQAKQLQDLGLVVDELRSRYLNGKLFLKATGKSIFEQLDKVAKLTGIDQTFFEQVPLIKPTCNLGNDPLVATQWNLERIEWDVDFASCNDATVCILDEGCELGHEDLDFFSAGLNLGSMQPDGSPTGNHGTACAGIASARTNNAKGVAGVSSTKILPLAVQTWSDVEITMGINYAAQKGVDVISMSFGVYPSWNFWDFSLIDPAIMNAHQRDVVLVAASGNENIGTENRYPGKHPLVITVGGSNKSDQRKSNGDSSSESWWGANYGLEQYLGVETGLSVVAPCLEIATTDRLGNLGYSATDYTPGFNGTSSATPMVAGIAALIRSRYSFASSNTIRRIIELSAEKVGSYVYAIHKSFPNGAWTQEMGYGRVNVRRAMKLAEQVFSANCGCHGGCGTSSRVSFSAQGTRHVSSGADSKVTFPVVNSNNGGGWQVNEFQAPKQGQYYFDLNFVKDAYYYGGTQDDVSLYLKVNGNQQYGSAWSGEGDGRRGTGAYSAVLDLKKNDVVEVYVHSDGNPTRHIASYSLSGFQI